MRATFHKNSMFFEIANEHYPVEAESKNQDADISKGLDAELASHGEVTFCHFLHFELFVMGK